MEYRVLGPFDVRRGDERVALGSFKQRSLLALLLIHANQVVSTDRIVDELWGEDVPTDRQNALWVHVSKLRSALEPTRSPRSEGTLILTRPPGYVLRVEDGELDAWRFERLVGEGRGLIDIDPAAASIVLAEALALWRGHPYEDFTYDSFARAEVARLEGMRVEAVEARIDADLRRGLAAELVGELESLVGQHPFREGFTGKLMLALYRAGRQTEALRAYGRLRAHLVEETGLEPSLSLRRLEEQIVLGDPSLDAPAAASPQVGLAVRGYELREEISAGAHGVTYRAYQPAVGREVAVEVIEAAVANDPSFVRRFEAEAEVVARLEHPHIVPVYDYWREPDAAYVVTRLFRGGTLADALLDGPLAPGRAAQMVHDVASALALAHRNGIVHGRVGGGRILLDDEGHAYLTDFDLGREVGDPDITTEIAADLAGLASVLADALPDDAVGGVRDLIDRAAGFPDALSFADAVRASLGVEPRVGASTPITNPYKGLRAFEEGDALDFFGRERLVERLIARLGEAGARGRFLAVVGPSGSGKSSVVKAGVVPAVRQGALPGSAQWFVVDITPGAHPFEALEAALLRVATNPPPSLLEELTAGPSGLERAVHRVLPDDGSQLLLVVDQLEELYTHARPETSHAFLEALAASVSDPSSRLRAVVTLRADFYDRPLRQRSIGELFRRGTEVVTPMSADEIARAVTAPADRMGIRFDPGVVAAVVADVADRAGALPLLQYALTELFDRRRGPSIDLALYRQAGGASGALVRRAEALFAEFDDRTREATRQVLLRLVTVGDRSEAFRRRIARREVGDLGQREVDVVIDTLGRHRLLSFDRDPVTREPTLEIAHEALVTEWFRLRTWIDDSRDDVRQHRRLTAAAAEWVAAGEDREWLLSGTPLELASVWAAASGLALNPIERRFLDASVARRDDERTADAVRRRREEQLRHANLRRGRQLVGAALVLAVLAGVAGFALVQRSDADRLAGELAAALEASRLATASINTSNDDPELATLLALASLDASASAGAPALAEAEDALHWAIQARRVTYPTTDAPVEARIGPNGLTGIYRMPLTDLIDLARRDLDRTFTSEQCSTYSISCPPAPGSLADPLHARTAPVPAQPERGAPRPSGTRPLAGTTVTLQWVDREDFGIGDELVRFEERTGIDVVLEPVRVAGIAASGTTPPDILIAPPSLIPELADDVQLVDLSTYLDRSRATRAFGPYLIDLMSVGPAWHAVPFGHSLKGLVWYPRAAFEAAGYAVPGSWDDLIALSERMVADGRTPWCMGLGSGEATGWPATDWIESLLLRTAGIETYDRWTAHEIPFDDPAVLAAVDRFGEIAFGDGYVLGGAQGARLVNYAAAPYPMLEEPPGCWLHHQASFVLTDLPAGTRLGSNVDYFPLPPMVRGGDAPLLGAGDGLAAATDRPEVRELMRAVLRPDWGEAWASHPASDFLPAHLGFDARHCATPAADPGTNGVRVRLCEESQSALGSALFRFDASDLMPSSVGLVDDRGQPGAFFEGMIQYLAQGPDSAGPILSGIEARWDELDAAAP